MTHEEALKVLLDEIDMLNEIYEEVETEIKEAMKFACSCILREMKKNA